jgi:hypothetical protein
MFGRASVERGAARTAALVALPVALVAGILAYRLMDRGAADRAGPRGAQATTPVEMPARPLADRPAAVCRALFARLPEKLGALPRRPVTTGPQQNAAYGDPPVTVACGAPGPSAPAGTQYLGINGVCWYADVAADDAVWSLAGREVPLVVTIPARYTGQNLVDLAEPIKAAVPPTADTPC